MATQYQRGDVTINVTVELRNLRSKDIKKFAEDCIGSAIDTLGSGAIHQINSVQTFDEIATDKEAELELLKTIKAKMDEVHEKGVNMLGTGFIDINAKLIAKAIELGIDYKNPLMSLFMSEIALERAKSIKAVDCDHDPIEKGTHYECSKCGTIL